MAEDSEPKREKAKPLLDLNKLRTAKRQIHSSYNRGEGYIQYRDDSNGRSIWRNIPGLESLSQLKAEGAMLAIKSLYYDGDKMFRWVQYKSKKGKRLTTRVHPEHIKVIELYSPSLKKEEE